MVLKDNSLFDLYEKGFRNNLTTRATFKQIAVLTLCNFPVSVEPSRVTWKAASLQQLGIWDFSRRSQWL